jgi:hypothetical protein
MFLRPVSASKSPPEAIAGRLAATTQTYFVVNIANLVTDRI